MTSPVSPLATVRENIARSLRDWLHGTPLSRCDNSTDECPDWPLAYELADLVLDSLDGMVILTRREAELIYDAATVWDDEYRDIQQESVAVLAARIEEAG